MQAIGLTFIDWVIILIYFAFVLGIGFYLRKFTKSHEDFFLAGRKNSSWVAVMFLFGGFMFWKTRKQTV